MKREFKVLGQVEQEAGAKPKFRLVKKKEDAINSIGIKHKPKFIVLGSIPQTEPIKRRSLVKAYNNMMIQLECDKKSELYQARSRKPGPPIRIYPLRDR